MNIEASSPYRVELAIWIASSSLPTSITGKDGAKHFFAEYLRVVSLDWKESWREVVTALRDGSLIEEVSALSLRIINEVFHRLDCVL